MTERQYIWRVVIVTLLVVVVWGGLGFRLAFLHLVPNERLAERIRRIRYHEENILGRRGRILDRNGNLLALDLPAKDVCVDPVTVMSNRQVSAVTFYLARILDLPIATVFSRVQRPGRRFEYIKRKVNEELAGQIERLRMQGVFFRDTTSRNYPAGETMCHVVGFSNLEGVGSAGIEQEMDHHLRGRPGLLVGRRDGQGRPLYLWRDLEIEPKSGLNVKLTLDQNLQFYVEEALDEAMQAHNAKGCWAIIQQVRTGEILALASRPAFDPNAYRTAPRDAMLNRAIGYVYEPGSTMKGIVLAAALNEKLVSPDDVFDCEDGLWHYANRPLRDYHPHGLLTVKDILKKSSNIGMAKVALKIGEQRLEDYLRRFGFGAPTGVELPGEEAGILHPASEWSKIKISRVPIGQGIAVTALQMLNAYACIANDGFLMRPYVVAEVFDEEWRPVMEAQPEVLARPIDQQTARLMQTLLGRVSEEGGTARRARVDGYAVAGKTGTAQKPEGGGYSQTDYMASFVGFLPARQPEIGIIVVVDEPQPLHTGGSVAAPVFRRIAEQAVRYLDIPPYDADPMILLGQAP